MFVRSGESKGRFGWLALLLAVALVGCELDVSDPAVIERDEVEGPANIGFKISGLIGDLNTMTEDYTLYTSLFTDEMVLAGTFPSRLQVDERRVVFSNVSTTPEVNEHLQEARTQADSVVTEFEGFLGNEEFDQGLVRDGIAFGKFVGGMARLNLGELYCEIPLEGGGNALSSDEIVSRALTYFEDAEARAGEALDDGLGRSGLEAWQQAAILGQARAHLWLGQFAEAQSDAARVDREHRLFMEYSTNNPEQFNKIFGLTWGNQNDVIRWTVGDGTLASRDEEEFALYDTFVDFGIIVPPPNGLTAFDSSIPVHAQKLYDENADDLALSTGLYAQLIEAETQIRLQGNGSCTQDALVDCEAPGEALINDARADWATRWTFERFPIEGQLGTIDEKSQDVFGDDFEDITFRQKMLLVADEIARETWLTGVRQETLRRFVREFGERENTPMGTQVLDLYPVKTQTQDQECWPVPEQEIEGAPPS